ncbi:hypothetical protein Tco_0494663 [Tanacetum coccineum]
MDFPEFYKELEAEFLGAGAKRMGLQLIKLEIRFRKIPSRSTDKTKITRKSSKTGKHRHEEWKSTKEAGKSSQSQLQECHVDVKKAQEKRDFTLLSLTEQTQTSQSRIATLAIRVRSFSDLTAQDDSPIIEKLYGYD